MQKHIVVNDGLTQNSIAASTVNQIRRMMAWADNCKRLQHLMRATLFTQTEVSQGPVTNERPARTLETRRANAAIHRNANLRRYSIHVNIAVGERFDITE